MPEMTPVVVLVFLFACATGASAVPIDGPDCAACHSHQQFWPGATTVTGHDGTIDPNGQGALKVIRVHPGQTRALQFSVGGWDPNYNNSGSSHLYATAFRNFLNPGLNGGTLLFAADPAWLDRTTIYNLRKSTYTGATKAYSFNITIDPAAQPDYYLVDFMTGIYTYDNADLGQVGLYGWDPFYLQVLTPGDVEGDTHVDVTDLLYLVDAFGSITGDANYSTACDFNNDGSVDVVDLLTMVENFGV